MEKVKVSKPQFEDLKSHKNCELQLRDIFKDGSLYLYCLDHEVVLMGVGE